MECTKRIAVHTAQPKYTNHAKSAMSIRLHQAVQADFLYYAFPLSVKSVIMLHPPTPSLIVHPIGIIRTEYTKRYAAPRQPEATTHTTEAIIELHPHANYEQALHDLIGFEKIWVLYWFHYNTTWKPKVLPPRSGRTKRGLFATRTPHRPNPIGMSAVALLHVQGRTLHIQNPDMLDGTPVLDIKPYIPYADAFPTARAGWIDELPSHSCDVHWSATALSQHHWLLEHHAINLRLAAEPILQLDPTPHPYRRITKAEKYGFTLSHQSWRIHFHIDNSMVLIHAITSGYSPETLRSAPPHTLHHHAAHVQFHQVWHNNNTPPSL